jgi:putative addiction module component (TIGR02574 family)
MTSPAINIEKLSLEERLRLIEALWESLRARPESVPLTRVQRDELDRGEIERIPWEEVKQQLRDRSK